MNENKLETMDYSTAQKVLQVKNLRVNFKSDSGLVYAVRGVSFDLYKGETLCIVGESGSGKSVTSKTIMGILANNAIIESGQILYEGEDLVRISEEEFHRIRGHKIGMIFQDPLSSLNPICRVGKQITEATLINRNILKKHYYELISKELVALRNTEANAYYETHKNEDEINKIKDFIKKLNDKKIENKEEILSEVNEYILLSKKNVQDEIETLHEKIAKLEAKTNLDNEFFEDDIKNIRLSYRNFRLDVFVRFNNETASLEDNVQILNAKIGLLKKLTDLFNKEHKELKPFLKKALNKRKKIAKEENKAYAAELKNAHEAKILELTNTLHECENRLEALLPTLNEEENNRYHEILRAEKERNRKLKKDVPEEINISKMGKKVEVIDSTLNEEFDKVLFELRDLKKEIEKENDAYINQTKITSKEAKKMALNVMKEVGIPLPEKRFKQYPFEFSGGMRQRIVIAIALTANPDILICDEPTTALDVTIQAQILELINKLKRERGLSCIFITHDLGVVANMADRVAVMYAGKIVEYGTSYEIFFNPKHPYTWALLSSIPDLDSKEKLEAIPGTPPDMRFPPKGDAFALRSKYALDIDFKHEPPFFKVSDTHYAATWLLHEDAPKMEMPRIVKTRIANSLKAFEEDVTTDNDALKEVVPEESFELLEDTKLYNEAMMKSQKPDDYNDYLEGHINVTKDQSISHKDVDDRVVTSELEGLNEEEKANEIEEIKSRCKYKEEYVNDKVILSVNHLKQYFFFGKGINKFKLKAVHDVNFQVKEGECFGIVGESGCGKTTTGRSIIRLYHITSGSIYYKGYRIGAGDRWNQKEIKYTNIRYKKKVAELKKKLSKGEISKEEYREEYEKATTLKNDINKVQKAKIAQIHHDDKHVNRKLLNEIQMIFQDPIDSLDPRMTVEDIIQEGLLIQGQKNKKENHEKVVNILEKVGLIADYCNRYPHEFSGGQRQRIGIARALIMNPKLLICDEPISALDVSIRAQIINLLNDLKEEMGLTIMFIAHDLSVVKYFCDRIAVMYFGEIVELATSDELFRHPLHPYTKSLLSAIPKPNPLTEKARKRIPYNPREAHDYSVDKPRFVEIEPGHFILANTAEIAKYKEEIVNLDEKAKEEEKELQAQIEEVRKEAALEEPKASVVEDSNKVTSNENKEDSSMKDVKVVSNESNKKEPSETLLKQRSGQIKKVYHLKKVDDKWELILKEGMKVIKTFPTKAEALEYSKALAKSQNGTLLVHASKGKNKGKFQK